MSRTTNSLGDALASAAVQRSWRVLTASRVFALAIALALTVTSRSQTGAATLFLALCVLAAVMSLPMPASSLRLAAPVAEAALAALILIPNSSAATALLVYLAIPPFVAGVQVGLRGAIVTAAVEPVIATIALLASHQAELLPSVVEHLAPWMLVGIGLGLLGSWMRVSADQVGGEQAGYASAHRLLGQLRAVSRRLSTGLDTSALAEQMLLETSDCLSAERAVALVVADGGLSILASHGTPFREQLEHDPVVEDCWHSEAPQSRQRTDAGGAIDYRVAVPLRVGSRVIGVVVSDCPHAPDEASVARLRTYLDEHSLRLEAALLFDEIRSTATLEERSRLAREIHDGIAQEVASLGYLVDELAACASAAESQELAHQLRRELSRVVSELRLSIFDLRSNVSPHAGLGLALSDYAREVGRRAGMTVHLALSENAQRLHINVETELLRIAQEAITNARKHARANNLWVTLNTESPIVMLRVEDDGVGSVQPRADHYGLRMMQERAQRIGAEIAIAPRRLGGTSVVVNVWPNTLTPGEQDAQFSSAR